MVNEHILSQIVNENEKEVFKSMRGDMNTARALLNDEQFNTFMRAAITEQSILADASFRKMNTMNQVVSNTKIVGRVLQTGYKTVDGAQVTQNELTEATIGFGKAELNSTKLKAKTSILDDDKEDNIEREQFEQTLLTMMGEAVGLDIEALNVFGDSSYTSGSPAAPDKLFSTYDGWLTQTADSAINSQGVITAAGSGTADFDLDDTVEAMFDAMIGKMPTAYRAAGLLNRMNFYVPWEVYDSYQNLLASRETGLGDTNVTGRPNLTYKNIPVKYSPVLDAEDGRTVYGNVPSILTIPEFLWYGVYKDLSVEPNRVVAQEKTEYFYRIRCAAGVQWKDAVIAANITSTEAAEIQEEHRL
jgi:hypothetical protein